MLTHHVARARSSAAIPTSSMADIAFLLLIFFLVTTTINVDTGIGMVLPPPLDQPPPQVHDRNLLSVLVSSDGRLLVEGQPMMLDELRAEVRRHVMNCDRGYDFGCVAEYAASPAQAVVSIGTSTSTSYRSYIGVLDEIWMAYFELWDDAARRLGFMDYAQYLGQLGDNEPNVIRGAIKAQISITEPED